MPSIAPVVFLTVLLLGAAPASAQVINGESTYGDSDLHQPPAAEPAPVDEKTKVDPRSRPPQQPDRR